MKPVSQTAPPVEHLYNVPLVIKDLTKPGLFRLPKFRSYKILESASWPSVMTKRQAVGLASFQYRRAWKQFLAGGKWEHFLLKRTGYRPE